MWKEAMLATFIDEYRDTKLSLREGIVEKDEWARMEKRLAELEAMLEKRKHVGRGSRLLAHTVSIHSD